MVCIPRNVLDCGAHPPPAAHYGVENREQRNVERIHHGLHRLGWSEARESPDAEIVDESRKEPAREQQECRVRDWIRDEAHQSQNSHKGKENGESFGVDRPSLDERA
jgi:hypothetical protein